MHFVMSMRSSKRNVEAVAGKLYLSIDASSFACCVSYGAVMLMDLGVCTYSRYCVR